MTTFHTSGYALELFNVRTESGALRAVRLWGAAADGQRHHLTLWFLAGEPMPRVERGEDGAWEASFPMSHFDVLVGMMRHEGSVRVALAEPDVITVGTIIADG